jgi:hypothetical protein
MFASYASDHDPVAVVTNHLQAPASTMVNVEYSPDVEVNVVPLAPLVVPMLMGSPPLEFIVNIPPKVMKL